MMRLMRLKRKEAQELVSAGAKYLDNYLGDNA